MTRRLRRATFLALLVLGCFGLLGTGSGVLAGPSWVWLAVLVLAVAHNVGHTHADRTRRLSRMTERRFAEALDQIRLLRADLDEQRALLTPEGVKHLHSVVQKMAEDLKPMREDWESVRAAGGWRSLLKR